MATFYAMTVLEFLGEFGPLQRGVSDLEWCFLEEEGALIAVRTGVSEVALQVMTYDEFVPGARNMIVRKNRHCCRDCPADVHRKATALPWTFCCATHGTDLHDVGGAALADIWGPVRFDALHSHAKTSADTLNSWARGEGQAALGLIEMLFFVTTRHRLASPPNVSEQPRMSLGARRDYQAFLSTPIIRQALAVVVPEANLLNIPNNDNPRRFVWYFLEESAAVG